MKRKGFDEVYDDFSSLSLSAPAAKSRRLDADLLPCMEMRETVGWPVFELRQSEGSSYDAVTDTPQVNMMPVLSDTSNNERALVLYKPLHPQYSPSLQMDPRLISDLKNPVYWSGNQNLPVIFDDDQQPSSVNSLALVPWVPSATAHINGTVEEDAMEAIEDSDSMEIEGQCGKLVDTGVGAPGFHQWQQHCMIPELSHVTSTPMLGSCVLLSEEHERH